MDYENEDLVDEGETFTSLEHANMLIKNAREIIEKGEPTIDVVNALSPAKTLSEAQGKMKFAIEQLQFHRAENLKVSSNDDSGGFNKGTVFDVPDGMNISNENLQLIKRTAKEFIRKTEEIARKADVCSVAGSEAIKNAKEIMRRVDEFYKDFNTLDFAQASKRDPEAFKEFMDLINNPKTPESIRKTIKIVTEENKTKTHSKLSEELKELLYKKAELKPETIEQLRNPKFAEESLKQKLMRQAGVKSEC